MIKSICSGNKIKISENIYYYFLEVLPPLKMFDNGFLFAEGYEEIKKFTEEEKGFFCIQTKEFNKFD